MTSLTDLANEFGSDKGTMGPQLGWTVTNYTDVYGSYLGHLRKAPLNLLEVGMGVPGENWDAQIARGRNVGGGGSVKMWHAFFPAGNIFGLDINPAPHLDTERLTTAVVDQGDRQSLNEFAHRTGVEFDVIIDDGSHRPDHQQITLEILLPHLKPAGYFFIEDLMDNGIGDPNRGRFSSGEVLNTRRLLKGFAQTGEFASPNAFENPQEMAKLVASVTFHSPRIQTARLPVGVGARQRLRNVVKGFDRFLPNSERLCMIRRAS